MDGCTLDTEGEKDTVVKCLEAAIQRRVSEVRETNYLQQFSLFPYMLLLLLL